MINAQQYLSQTLMTESNLKKQIDFYTKAKKQYEQAPKPVTYEFHLTSSQPRPRKFLLLVSRFCDIFKEGMKDAYAQENETSNNYWNQLQKNYGETPQIGYIVKNIYEKKKNKLRIYFCLLIRNYIIFQSMESFINQMQYMYTDPKGKLNGLKKEFELVMFLHAADIIIMSEYVTEYDKYVIICKEEAQFKRKEEERKKREEIQAEIQRVKKEENEKKLAQEKAEQIRKRNQAPQLTTPKLTMDVKSIPAPVSKHPTIMTPLPPPPKLIQIRNDTQYINHRPTHEKASDVLFNQHYKDELEVFTFRLKPQVSKDKLICFQCKQPLSEGLYFFGGNSNYCNYTGQWYCNNDISEERMPIPWKAIENFDLRGYQVSKKSLNQIKNLYQRPLIQFHSQDDVLKTHQKLYEFLVLKRQIHLMYDAICNSQFMQKLLQKKLNYCLKRHLFSLKNLYDIYNGLEGPSLQRQYDLICKHFYKCQICQKKKGYICGKCNYPPKIFPFELRSTYACKICRKMYHRTCLINNRCDCTAQ